MTVPRTSSLLPGYLYQSDDLPNVAFYCEACTSFYVRGFADKQELEAFKAGQPFSRASNCPYCSGYPFRCSEHIVTYVGDAPPRMLAWLEAGQPNWPKCPEDFIDGEDDAEPVS